MIGNFVGVFKNMPNSWHKSWWIKRNSDILLFSVPPTRNVSTNKVLWHSNSNRLTMMSSKTALDLTLKIVYFPFLIAKSHSQFTQESLKTLPIETLLARAETISFVLSLIHLIPMASNVLRLILIYIFLILE